MQLSQKLALQHASIEIKNLPVGKKIDPEISKKRVLYITAPLQYRDDGIAMPLKYISTFSITQALDGSENQHLTEGL